MNIKAIAEKMARDPELLKRIAKADEDIREGRYVTFATVEELQQYLEDIRADKH